jgi:ATP-binding cassette, subfamily B, heavy metal transporter
VQKFRNGDLHSENFLNGDHTIVLDKGVIIEQGTHESLLSLKGKYYEMWGKQKPKSSE